MVPERNSMVRKSSTAPELHLYGSGEKLYGPEILHSTRTASLWFRRETLWSGSAPGHWNCISMVLAINSTVRKSSTAPELHLYGSGRQLYGLEKTHTTSTQKGHANQHRTTPCWDCSIPTRIATQTHKASLPQTHTLSTDMTSGHQTTTQGTVTATLRYTAWQ